MEGKPFVLLGVNSDGDRAKLRERLKEERISWRSWWDGGDTFGPIASRFNIQTWPSYDVLDHRGIIRHKWADFPGDETFDSAIDALVAAAEGDASKAP